MSDPFAGRSARGASRSFTLGIGMALTVGALLPGAAGAQDPPAQPPHDRPGPAVDRLLFKAFDVDRAPLDLQAGNMDLYLFGLKTEAAQDLRDAEGVQLFEAPATSLSLVLNPAPEEGGLNPFSIPAVRSAMQYLVDRQFIAQDLYQGMALPMITHVGPSDPDFLTVYDIDRGSRIRYEPELGRELIAEAMTGAGAELVNGVWHFGGEPITLRFIGRVEDERRQISDLVRAELEAAGFAVTMNYQSFAPAVQTVYSTDPAAFGWHLYTEGWGRGAPQRYDVGTVNAMTAPWLGNMPGWREEGFWQYEQPRLDELGQRLFRGEFDSLDERNEIYREMTQLGLDESVRIWLATVVNSFPARADLADVTTDVVAGPRSPWMLREAYAPGKDELTVGNLWVWTERTTWNPIGGMGDVYSNDIWRNLSDPPLWNHPFTGLPEPFRADFEVTTAGPDGTLDVPSDAVLWDAEADRWQEVGPGVTAVSAVTFDYSRYLGTKWHHGQPITIADAVYSIAQGFELAYDPDKSRVEVALAVTSRPYLETLRGFRVLDDGRLEVYVDFWHFDDAYIAAYASPAGFAMPWEILAAMDDLVFEQRRAAYSDTSAARYSVPWLSLAVRRDAGLVDRTLRQFERDQVVPEGVFQVGDQTLVTPDEALERYAAAQAWHDEHDHMVISNGPFFMATYDPGKQFAQLDAFRDETYPFRPGDRYLGQPPTLDIGDVDAPAVAIGEDASISVSVSGPGQSLRYLLVDPATGGVVASGDAAQGEVRGQFRFTIGADVTGNLFPGPYQLYLAASSDQIARVAERRVDLEVTP